MDLSGFSAWLLARLQEPSTWAGLLTAGGTLVGCAIAPEKASAIASLGTLVASAVAVLTKERPKG